MSKKVRLTRREDDVLRGLRSGLGNKEIAMEMDIGEGTIRMYLRSIGAKTGLRGRVAIALWAERRWQDQSGI